MRTLAVNCGSSTLKFKLVEMANGGAAPGEEREVAGGTVDRVGGDGSEMDFSRENGASLQGRVEVPDHGKALCEVLDWLRSAGLVHSDGPEAVRHRIVHGADHFAEPVLVDDEVVSTHRGINRPGPAPQRPVVDGDTGFPAGVGFLRSDGRGIRHRFSPHDAGARRAVRHPGGAGGQARHPTLRVPWHRPPVHDGAIRGNYRRQPRKRQAHYAAVGQRLFGHGGASGTVGGHLNGVYSSGGVGDGDQIRKRRLFPGGVYRPTGGGRCFRGRELVQQALRFVGGVGSLTGHTGKTR